jgi:hypothetical protein
MKKFVLYDPNRWPDAAMRYVLKTETDKDVGLIRQELISEFNGLTTMFSKWIIKTRDEGVRKALVDLGWTPPNERMLT